MRITLPINQRIQKTTVRHNLVLWGWYSQPFTLAVVFCVFWGYIMEKRNSDYLWIPLWVDKWLFGSTRIELEPAERAVWIDLLALASKDNGHIRANVGVPYSKEQLAGLLCIPLTLLESTIKKCLTPQINKLNQLDDNSLYIINWQEYQLSKRHKRRFMSPKADTMDKKAATKSNQIILNNKDLCPNSFEQFWLSYPKKQTKKKALQIWLKLKPDQDLISKILKALEVQKQTNQWQKEKGKYIPYPTTWLNQARWEDEVEVIKDWRE